MEKQRGTNPGHARKRAIGSGHLTPWQAYLFAIAVTSATLWFRISMDDLLGGRPTLVMFTLPIMLSAYVGGLRGGLLSTALTYLGASYYLLAPIHSFTVASSVERWQQFFLATAGIFISVMNEALHRARRRADVATTEHRQAEAAVRASEERLRMVTDNARVGLVMVDRERRYTFANATYAEILGLSATLDLVGRRVPDVLGSLYDDQVRPRLDRAFDGERVNYELQRPTVDGDRFYTVRYEPTIADATVAQVIVVLAEITERKRADQAMQASEARYRALFEYAPDGIVIADAESFYLDANASMCRMLGYTRDELIGLHASDIVAPQESKMVAPALDEIKSRSDHHREWQFRRKDGSLFHAEVLATMMPDGNLMGMIRDVTERKEAEEAAAQTLRRLTEAQRIGQIGDWEFDLASEAVTWSPQVYEILGRDPHLGPPQSLAEGAAAYDAQSAALIRQRVARAIESGEPQDYELVGLRPNGTRVHLQARAIPRKDASGRVVGLFGTVQDITERKQTEEKIQRLNAELEHRVIERTAQLETANKQLEAFATAVSHDLRVAEAADQMKSSFLSTMSHELRTPLNSIIGFTSIVLQGLPGPVNAEQSRQLGTVLASARHLLSLINDVLDLSKIESGQMELHLEAFDLRASLDQVLAQVKPLADTKGLALRLTPLPSLAPIVSDRRRVDQILLNLLSNAVKFTEHGTITVTVEAVAGDDSSTSGSSSVQIHVADTGIGIKPENLEILFQPFRQVDSSLTRRHDGTGLGLVICQRLAQLLGGGVSVISAYGSGSRFTVSLPTVATTDAPG